jgi:hypothetical protein
MNELQR